MSTSEESSIGLPDLHQAELDEAMVRALFRDIAALTRVVDIIPKMASRAMVPDAAFSALDLEGALNALFEGSIHGVQLRYDFDGLQWWDSLLRLPVEGRFRLVRISHDLTKMG